MGRGSEESEKVDLPVVLSLRDDLGDRNPFLLARRDTVNTSLADVVV